ncbi:MAG: hypothetical protein ABI317_00680 [Gaiellales bacterium]
MDARLLLSARTADDILFRHELDALEGVSVSYALTRSWPDDWTGFQRRIDADMLEAVAPAPSARPHTFVCGPTPFVENAANLLVSLGHEARWISAERFGPTGG